MLKQAYFAGGCFWCTEEIFKNLKGVNAVTSGYTGGESDHPDYQEVSGGQSGHAEAVKIEFNSDVISYADLLNVFFHTHDPTTLNRQGSDIGTQYRSAIFYADEGQKEESEEFIQKLEDQKAYENEIVTEVVELGRFFDAEDYHQDYFEKNKSQSYCQVIIAPKIDKLNEKFKDLVNDSSNS
jgi:peptide-methionine (S)-S-oxide reductase